MCLKYIIKQMDMPYILDDIWIYIIKLMSLDDILNLRQVNKHIKNLIYMHAKLYVEIKTYRQGTYLMSAIKNIKLRINKHYSFNDYEILMLTNLKSLTVHPYNALTNDITDRGLISLTSLKYLMVSGNKITDSSVSKLTNLKRLSIDQNCPITDESIRCLTKLTFLRLNFNTYITDSLKCLTNLKTLMLFEYNYYSKITDDTIGSLTNITHLDFSTNSITDNAISKLINLEYLKFENTRITDDSLKCLTNLKTLVMYDNHNKITDIGIRHLTNLETLEFNNEHITDNSIKYLRNLKDLKIWYRHNISMKHLLNLKNIGINIYCMPKYY